MQQLERFFQTLSSFLQSCGPGRPVLLSRVASSGPVQAEWATLQRCAFIGKTTKMKQVILQRPQTFSIIVDHCNQPHVSLRSGFVPTAVLQATAAIQQASSKGSEGENRVGFHDAPLTTQAGGQAAAANTMHSASEKQNAISTSGVPGPLPVGLVTGARNSAAPALVPGLNVSRSLFLRPEQVTAIEAYLRKHNGQQRLSKIGSQFAVKKAQLAEHFLIIPFGNDPIVTLKKQAAATKVAEILSSLSPSVRPHAIGNSALDVSQQLDQLLRHTVPSRHSVCDAMVFCLDNAQHAALLARRLTASMGEKELSVDAALARLFVISDVLNNSKRGKPGAARYLSSLQDLLPEAFEQFGREWFRRIENPIERIRAERRVKEVLSTWQSVSAFPRLFVNGLEALFFAPVLEDANIVPSSEPDDLLRRKLTRWFSAADQVRLPSACRLRGLAGKALSTAACRARLCHFERYWHRPGISVLEEEEDLFGDSDAAVQNADALPPDTRPNVGSTVITRHQGAEEDEPLDGDLLTDEDLAALGMLDGESLLGDPMEVEFTSAATGLLDGARLIGDAAHDHDNIDDELIFAQPDV